MRKTLCTLLCLAFVLALVPITVFAETIFSIEITDADITPAAGEKAGDHSAFTLPENCGYLSVMNGWWDIFRGNLMADDDVFQDGGLYCVCWNIAPDEGNEFAESVTVTVNGSPDCVDTEHSYIDTSREDEGPLYIISLYGVMLPADTPCPGDANRDGSVTAKDASVLAKHLAGWDIDADLSAADTNADGTVNAKDLALLMKYLAGWDVTLGG